MVQTRRYTVEWTGGPGGPGVSTFHSVDQDGMAAALHTFFTSVADRLADSLTIQVNNTGIIFDSVTGEANGNFSDVAQASIDATGAGGVAAPAGAHVNWLTGTFKAGSHVRGRTFLVPLAAGAYETDGTLGSVALADIQAAADALVTSQAGALVIWARPFDGDPAATPPKPARDGSIHSVNQAQVPDKVAVLTSRRD